jgi:hypothetical protein
VPVDSFKYESGKPKLYKQDNGVIREFCDNCGAYICEYGVRPPFQGPMVCLDVTDDEML